MPFESASVRPPSQQVYVAIYEHPHGADVRVFTHAWTYTDGWLADVLGGGGPDA
ncbi:hypothetical protein [Sphingobium sp.]|uniref:hypothetical protein n=1 Tax=Sphingobium sp. TaxID=1912891 RepID=UPI00257A8297|nr:hypothetical protein [Sphingobium sp.]